MTSQSLLRGQFSSPLARRLILTIILVSTALTLLLTGLQLWVEYRLEIKAVETAFRQIEDVHLKLLSQSLWETDVNALELQTAGIVRLPGVEYVAVREGDKVWGQAGRRASLAIVERQFAMTFEYLDRTLDIGSLVVVAGLDAVYSGLAFRALGVLAANALKTFLVAAFAFFLFHWLVTRRLQFMVRHLRGLTAKGGGAPLQLPRVTRRKPDELDEVAMAINQLGSKGSAAIATLRDSEAKLEVLARQLLLVQETERRAIARDLHDEVGGILTAVKLSLQSLRGERLFEAALADSLELVDGALGTVRAISADLRPAILDDLGLIPALTWYCERQALRGGIPIELALEAIDLKSTPQLESACFRIVQEAMTNVLRHAKANCIRVALRRGSDGFVLEIADDGSGFDIAVARQSALVGESSGLLGMEKRATLLGGRLSVESAKGAGTSLRAEFSFHDGAIA